MAAFMVGKSLKDRRQTKAIEELFDRADKNGNGKISIQVCKPKSVNIDCTLLWILKKAIQVLISQYPQIILQIKRITVMNLSHSLKTIPIYIRSFAL